MKWRRWIQLRSRDADFLWRMVIGILLVGVAVGLAVDATFEPWVTVAESAEGINEPDPPEGEDARMDRLAQEGKWVELIAALTPYITGRWRQVGLTSLAVLTGLCWLAFAVQAVQVRSWRDGRLWGAFAAVALGVLSIWPTVFLIFWQEHQWGLARSIELGSGAKFYLLGVGLREELS
jgi:hypothetical protein